MEERTDQRTDGQMNKENYVRKKNIVLSSIVGRVCEKAIGTQHWLNTRLESWAERDTAVNLYPVDVATTPFSATWRNDAIY